ncbi:MAG: DUF4340 domain-containing protein [Oscillospiraceae bacterium]|nr:DUF4340 domain-containing protein [Oscillospiraceae bacterium]
MKKISNKVKIILFSLTGALILTAMILILWFTEIKEDIPPPPEPPPVQNTLSFFDNYSGEDVREIRITNRNDSGYTVLVTPDGDVSIAEFEERSEDIPYNTQGLINAVNSIGKIFSREVVEEDADLGKYGLDIPTAEVNVKFADDTSVTFYIGDYTPTGGDLYFRIEFTRDVHVVNENIISAFSRERYYWMSKQLFSDYDSEKAEIITRAEILRKGKEPFIIEAIPSVALEETRSFNTHKLTSPIGVEIDQIKSAQILFGLFGMYADEAAWVGLEELDYKNTGTDDPENTECIVKISTESETITLTVGDLEPKNKQGHFVISSEHPDVLYFVRTENLPWLAVKAEDLIAEMFLTPYIYSLERVLIEAGEISLDVPISEGETSEAFRDFYQFLVAARGEELFMSETTLPEQDLLARITYVYKDDTFAPDILEYYKSENLKSVICVNGVNLFKVRDLYTTRLVENINSYMNGGDINYDW